MLLRRKCATVIPVLIDTGAGNGFRARGCEPFALVAEGATREEALQKVRAQLQERLQAGAQIVPLDVQGQENPWVEFADMFKDDPLFDDWQAAIAENRRKADTDPDVP